MAPLVSSNGDDQVQRITSAPTSYSVDHATRMRRYVISMSIRTVCVVLVIVIDHPVRWVFAVGAVLLPYVAVVMANAGRGRRSSAVPVPAVPRRALPFDAAAPTAPPAAVVPTPRSGTPR